MSRGPESPPPLPEIWVWLPREREGRIAPAAFELLAEARGLARRLEAEIVVLSDRDPDPAERESLAGWEIAADGMELCL